MSEHNFKSWTNKAETYSSRDDVQKLMHDYQVSLIDVNVKHSILCMLQQKRGKDTQATIDGNERQIKKIADSIVESQKTEEILNDKCHLCLEEKAKQPMYCVLCAKVISCKSCLQQYFLECTSSTVKCLNCQRESFLNHILFRELPRVDYL
ncbi:unnamed protein product [Bursaphelenchus okinawaensis]|uniref:RING-type domain-containing protein n=1 Tax=Bursaphelenchus okinawaensis TaxID=465554 RepID=A0A811JQE2_9BILA|nr:unnamed protein product [Bursaphelenchus okinawaensis]CAG9077639.1 unnamed protein product [Bursaphelenchus okinawaensis]